MHWLSMGKYGIGVLNPVTEHLAGAYFLFHTALLKSNLYHFVL